jgi:hypothetical protein
MGVEAVAVGTCAVPQQHPQPIGQLVLASTWFAPHFEQLLLFRAPAVLFLISTQSNVRPLSP